VSLVESLRTSLSVKRSEHTEGVDISMYWKSIFCEICYQCDLWC